MTWRWINKQALLRLHDESLAEHGGIHGLRDGGLLDSALICVALQYSQRDKMRQSVVKCDEKQAALLALTYSKRRNTG